MTKKENSSTGWQNTAKGWPMPCESLEERGVRSEVVDGILYLSPNTMRKWVEGNTVNPIHVSDATQLKNIIEAATAEEVVHIFLEPKSYDIDVTTNIPPGVKVIFHGSPRQTFPPEGQDSTVSPEWWGGEADSSSPD